MNIQTTPARRPRRHNRSPQYARRRRQPRRTERDPLADALMAGDVKQLRAVLQTQEQKSVPLTEAMVAAAYLTPVRRIDFDENPDDDSKFRRCRNKARCIKEIIDRAGVSENVAVELAPMCRYASTGATLLVPILEQHNNLATAMMEALVADMKRPFANQGEDAMFHGPETADTDAAIFTLMCYGATVDELDKSHRRRAEANFEVIMKAYKTGREMYLGMLKGIPGLDYDGPPQEKVLQLLGYELDNLFPRAAAPTWFNQVKCEMPWTANAAQYP